MSVRPADAAIAFESIVVGVSGSVREVFALAAFFLLCLSCCFAEFGRNGGSFLRTWDETFSPLLELEVFFFPLPLCVVVFWHLAVVLQVCGGWLEPGLLISSCYNGERKDYCRDLEASL